MFRFFFVQGQDSERVFKYLDKCFEICYDILAQLLVDTTAEWRDVLDMISSVMEDPMDVYETDQFRNCVKAVVKQSRKNGKVAKDFLWSEQY